MIPKFRVYDKVECMMITTSDYDDLSDLFCLLKADVDTGYYSELMQSTGLFDKNGVEIFEGDVVRFGHLYEGFLNRVAWDKTNAAFKLVPLDKTWSTTYFSNFDYESTRSLEVVGNVYQIEEVENE